jgi:serine/threonine protein phosphatase 1
MAGRTIAVGDIHGELSHLEKLWAKLPVLDAKDTLVFLGDYVDRGPNSKGVIDFMRSLSTRTLAKTVFLRGNHEDGWLRVVNGGFAEFVLPEQNGCWTLVQSYLGHPAAGADPTDDEVRALMTGSFLPPEVLTWMAETLFWYEDEHAIYVHAGLPNEKGRFLHPSEVDKPIVLLWLRSREFFENYTGKRVICGHTATEDLPDISTYTPEDKTDLWYRGDVIAVDTRCGKEGGFLTAIELPALAVYESR